MYMTPTVTFLVEGLSGAPVEQDSPGPPLGRPALAARVERISVSLRAVEDRGRDEVLRARPRGRSF